MKCYLLHPSPRPGEVLLSILLLIQALSRSPEPPAQPTHFWMLLQLLDGCEVAAPLRREVTNATALPGSKQHLALSISPKSTWETSHKVSHKAFLIADGQATHGGLTPVTLWFMSTRASRRISLPDVIRC